MTKQNTTRHSREAGLRISSGHGSGIDGQRPSRLRIMKFGGTSVGDEFCIARVVKIVQAASREGSLVVVVSAMGGVTNKLIEAALQAEAGNLESVRATFQELRN